MLSSSFVAKIVKRGSSYTVTIPSGVAKLYGLNDVNVTLESRT